jgi:hypothetical protein
MFGLLGSVYRVVAHLHALQVAGSWLVKAGRFLFHSNAGFLGLSALMNHIGLN